MTQYIAHHEVKDVQHWLGSSTREEVFGPLGVTGITTFVDPQGSNRVGVLMEIPDVDAVMAMLQTEVGASAMERDGVLPETLVILQAS